MRSLIVISTVMLLSLFTVSCSSSEEQGENFKYLLDEFADIKVMRYKIPSDWDRFSLSHKEYIYHLSEAAKCGRDILWDQNFKYNLEVRNVLEAILDNYEGDREAEEFRSFLIYAKRVFFSNGIHHHYAEEKFIPGCTKGYFEYLMNESGMGEKSSFLIPVIYDKDLYRYRRYSGEGDIIVSSSVNFYDGVTQQETEKFYRDMEDPIDKTPISYGLNSKLTKSAKGEICEEVYRVGGLYGPIIEKIIMHLGAAALVTENNIQSDYITKLIEYYKTGDLKTWDEYNVLWVGDTDSDIDFINGFIETYNDPMGMKGTWEALVNFRDIEASERTDIISRNAQWFEDHSPIDERFRKEEVVGISAKVINAASLGGDCYPVSPLGINLPNADWIRRDHGSKSVTIANISDAYDKAAQESPKNMVNEFAWNDKEIALVKKWGSLTSNLHTDLHECLGHGSGKLLPGVSSNALKEYSSALEEARADLFALYYLADSKMLELGILPDKDAYKAEYANYIRNGIFTQFVRIEYGKKITQAHMQCRKLISEWSYVNGEGVIEKKVKNGKTYFVIKNYEKLREVFGKLLAEIQRIKSEGDYEAGRNLIETYAVNINPELHQEVLNRYATLDLKPYGGFINPEIVPVIKSNKIVDYKIEYYDDYLQQMLDYGKRYSYPIR